MSSNWVNALDACAAAGIIDYDAPAFIMGQSPRYIGHPDFERLPLKNDYLLPPGVKLTELPSIDTYGNPEDKPLIQNPLWKKVLFGAITIASLIAAGIGVTKLGKIKIPDLKINKAWDLIKKPFNYIASKFTH